jgi:hypothetical protein
MLVHNGTQDKNGVDLYEDIIYRTSLLTIDQVRDARELRQNLNNDREILDVEMMYECLKSSIEEDVATSIATKYEDIDQDGTMLWKVIMDNLSNKATKQQVRLCKATVRNLKMADYDNNVKTMNAEI